MRWLSDYEHFILVNVHHVHHNLNIERFKSVSYKFLNQFFQRNAIQVGVQLAYLIEAGNGRDAVLLLVVLHLHLEATHCMQVGRSLLALPVM